MPDEPRNRAERRRRQRAQEKTPVLIAGDGIVAGALGHRFEARPSADLPPKAAGFHRWVASGVWVIKDVDAARAGDVDHQTFLDNENLMMLAIWCWDCEKRAHEIKAGEPCRGAPS